MAITKNPLTIVQGAPTPSASSPMLTWVGASGYNYVLQTPTGDWYKPLYGQLVHGVLMENETDELIFNPLTAHSYRILSKIKPQNFNKANNFIWCSSLQTVAYPHLYYDTTSLAFLSFPINGTPQFIPMECNLLENEDYYFVISWNENDRIVNGAIYNQDGTLNSRCASGLHTNSDNVNGSLRIGGGPYNNQIHVARDCFIDIGETFVEVDGTVVWGATNTKTQNMGIFHFDNWSEFTEVEYIEATGTQWIDTFLKYKNGYKVEMEIEFTKSSAMYGKLIGAYLGNVGSLYYRLYFGGPYSKKWEVAFLNTFRDGGNGVGVCNTNTKYNVIFCTYSSNQYLSVNGNTLFSASYSYNADNSPNPNATIPYMATGVIGGSDAMTPHPGVKTYSLKFTDYDGNVVRNYKPCYHTAAGIIGMFDTVNNKFYPNAGTGEFIKGPDV